MEGCGYIYTGIRETNLQDRLMMEVYPCADVGRVTADTPVWRCSAAKCRPRVTETDPTTPPISSLTLSETVRTAVRLDKELRFPAVLSFRLDADGNPVLKFEKNIKEIFPVPDKQAIFGTTKYYINVTSAFDEGRYLTPLLASTVCDLLNCLAVNSGFLGDRIFYQSCGRVFADADFFMYSLRARHILKNSFPDAVAALRKIGGGFEFSLRVTRRHMKISSVPEEIKGDDFRTVRHNAACRLVREAEIYDFAEHGDLVRALADAVVLGLEGEIALLVKNGALSKADDAKYVTADDILAAGFDAQCRANLDGFAATCRKFFNAAAAREIDCIDSAGRI